MLNYLHSIDNDVYKEIQNVIDKKGDDFEMCFIHFLQVSKTRRQGFDNVI